MNILVTSVNWRAQIVQEIKKSIQNDKGRLITIDSDPLAAGIYFSDKHYRVPLYSNEQYIQKLYQICIQEKINYIIPQTDRDCNYFSQKMDLINSWNLKNFQILMSNQETIKIVTDKLLCKKIIMNNNILTPLDYTDYNPDDCIFPLFIKPRADSGSKNAFIVNNKLDLSYSLSQISNPIIEEYISGTEYTVDGAANYDGSVIGLIPRKRISVKGGVSIKGVTVYEPELIHISKKIVQILRPFGFFCLQFIKKNEKYYFIEFNPRMGSGIVLSIYAGFNLNTIFRAYYDKEIIHLPNNFFKEEIYMIQYLKPIFKFENELL